VRADVARGSRSHCLLVSAHTRDDTPTLLEFVLEYLIWILYVIQLSRLFCRCVETGLNCWWCDLHGPASPVSTPFSLWSSPGVNATLVASLTRPTDKWSAVCYFVNVTAPPQQRRGEVLRKLYRRTRPQPC